MGDIRFRVRRRSDFYRPDKHVLTIPKLVQARIQVLSNVHPLCKQRWLTFPNGAQGGVFPK